MPGNPDTNGGSWIASQYEIIGKWYKEDNSGPILPSSIFHSLQIPSWVFRPDDDVKRKIQGPSCRLPYFIPYRFLAEFSDPILGTQESYKKVYVYPFSCTKSTVGVLPFYAFYPFSCTNGTVHVADLAFDTFVGFIKDEYYSWVQYKSGPGGRPSM